MAKKKRKGKDVVDKYDFEEVEHKLDTHVKYAVDDTINQVHEHGIDLKVGHIYLMGEESYILENNEDGVEPGVEFSMANRFIKNMNILMRKNGIDKILIHMKTCFSGKTPILTDKGQKKIKKIKVGDMVRTHKGRYKKVIDTMSTMYDGEMTRLYYGRKKHDTTSICGTSNHPILVERNSEEKWIPLSEVVEGDIIFVETSQCEFTGETVPFWRRKKNYNCDRLRRKGSGSGQKHLEDDILPYCKKLQEEGWIVVPVGAGVIPDIIGFKNGKITAFEVEKSTGKSLEVKKEKYEDASINEFIDNVEWHNPNNKEDKAHYTWYDIDEEKGFAKVLITGTKKWKNKYKQRVYNLTVEDDNSYVANHVVVHNCGGDWQEGMAIYDMIRACPVPVVILNYTHARSMSSLILQAADKRVMMPHSYFMFHDGDGALVGTQKQIESAYRWDQTNIKKQMIDVYVKSMKADGKMSKKPEAAIRTWLRSQMDKKEDVYLTPTEAIELGFADQIFNHDWKALVNDFPS